MSFFGCGYAELMLQIWESAEKGAPGFLPKQHVPGSVGLFIEVENFEDILRRLEGLKPAVPERTTFYGMREIGVYEPDGHPVIFAARVK